MVYAILHTKYAGAGISEYVQPNELSWGITLTYPDPIPKAFHTSAPTNIEFNHY